MLENSYRLPVRLKIVSGVAFGLLVGWAGAVHAVSIIGDTSDADIKYIDPTYSVVDLGNDKLWIGSRNASNGEQRNAVLVFQLAEDRPEEDEHGKYFVSGVDLKVVLAEIGNYQYTPDFDVDVYGIRWSGSSPVVTGDFSGGTLIEESFITPSDSSGDTLHTGPAGNAVLASWLDAQYTDGAGAGDYVFLGIRFDAPPTGQMFYGIASADHPTSSYRPVLTMGFSNLVPEPSSTVLFLFGFGLVGWCRRRRIAPQGASHFINTPCVQNANQPVDFTERLNENTRTQYTCRGF